MGCGPKDRLDDSVYRLEVFSFTWKRKKQLFVVVMCVRMLQLAGRMIRSMCYFWDIAQISSVVQLQQMNCQQPYHRCSSSYNKIVIATAGAFTFMRIEPEEFCRLLCGSSGPYCSCWRVNTISTGSPGSLFCIFTQIYGNGFCIF